MTLPNFSLIRSDGTAYSFSEYNQQVILVVNTATGCGLANQMNELQVLYDNYKHQGFVVLGFPSNQFKQEQVSDQDMASTCQMQFNTTFPLHQKITLNGPNAHPLYKWLRLEQGGLLSSDIKWNFTKFLIDRQGHVVKRYSPTKSPGQIARDIEKLL